METIKKVITDFMLFHYKEDNIEIFKTLFEGEEINTVEDVIHKMIDIYECEGKPEYLKSGNCNLADVINWVACSEREPDEEGIYYVYPDKYHYTAEYHKYGKWAGKWTVDDQNGYEYETVVKYWKRITPPCL